MKVYMQMLKHSYSMMPKISISLLLMMLSLTVYKLFFISDDTIIFSQSNVTIAEIVFRLIFTLIRIGILGQVLIILSGHFAVSILQMIPEIRKKAIIFTAR